MTIDNTNYTDNIDHIKLPAKYEKKYKNQSLKDKITALDMWSLIPSVPPLSKSNISKRLKNNDLLFSFIDQYLSDIEFAFEPVMKDGRFVCLPSNVSHQGFGICTSGLSPETHLEICHFWYPSEFTKKSFDIFIDQLYVPSFHFAVNDNQLIDSIIEDIKKVFSNTDDSKCCTFAFNNEKNITFNGDFLDDLESFEKNIRKFLSDQPQMIINKGESFINFARKLMEHAH